MSESLVEPAHVSELSYDEAFDEYVQLLWTIENVEDFRKRGSEYDLDASDAATYDELTDLEWLLDIG